MNKEITKNILRNRTCSTCSRLYEKAWCPLSDSEPEFGVCSQWEMKRSDGK